MKAEHRAREMMNGSREEFDYFECGSCGCLQIAEFPGDIGRHYSEGYYSVKPQSGLKRFLQDRRAEYLATGRGLVGRAVTALKPAGKDASAAPRGVPKTARVLEVGCGNGYYLQTLLELGFARLHGIDPFMDSAYVRERPIKLQQASLLDLEAPPGSYDCIVLGHTFEHIAEQHETMRRIAELLSPDGVCVLRIPWAESWAWEHYGVDWVQLDAPRHFFLHTSASLRRVAGDGGLCVQQIEHDSTAFQFWGSEQYRRNIPLYGSSSWLVDPAKSPFTAEQVAEFERRAAGLNAEGRGDQVTAYLRRAA